ncbi:hypothetical protein [Kerstersia gyiorum]|uniref:hypothetical protein n=1 Tax=Kerstersia gyiorum TaxID=206506 RepID=UPI00128FF1B3|nr:hypothetical protein [Kerstersia gyiorum]
MEVLAIIGIIAIVIFVFKKLNSTTSADKLTLLTFNTWLDLYHKEKLFQKSKMATALVIQSIQVANSMGLNISVNQFMMEKNKSKMSSIDVIDQWLEVITQEMTHEISAEEIDSLQARSVGGLFLLKMSAPSQYRIAIGK